MEELNLKLSASEINSKMFDGKNGGYDSLQVDKYLDLIVNDYISFEKFFAQVKKKDEEYKEITSLCNSYKKKLSEEEYKNALLKDKVSVLSGHSEDSINNIDLLKRISKLEQELYNLGKDPSKIK